MSKDLRMAWILHHKKEPSIDFMEKDNNGTHGYVRSYWLYLCIALLIGSVAWHFIERSQQEKLVKQPVNSQSKADTGSLTGAPPDSLHH
jgi:hypothetical protein